MTFTINSEILVNYICFVLLCYIINYQIVYILIITDIVNNLLIFICKILYLKTKNNICNISEPTKQLYFTEFTNRYIFYFFVGFIKLCIIDVLFTNNIIFKCIISLIPYPFIFNEIFKYTQYNLFKKIEQEKIQCFTIIITNIVKYLSISKYYSKYPKLVDISTNTDKIDEQKQLTNSQGKKQPIVTSYISPTISFQKSPIMPPNFDLISSK